MAEFYAQGKQEKLDFRQIILGHYKKILEISTSEYFGGFWKHSPAQGGADEYVPDKRKEFIQAVETLALALVPHFDKEMAKAYSIFLSEDKKLFNHYADSDGFIRDGEEKRKAKHSIQRLVLMQQLFKDLSCLMFRLDYFKTQAYQEGLEPDFVDVDLASKTPNKEED